MMSNSSNQSVDCQMPKSDQASDTDPENLRIPVDPAPSVAAPNETKSTPDYEQVTEVDYERYKKPELAESLKEVLALPDKVGDVILISLGVLFVLLGIPFIWLFDEKTWVITFTLFAMGIPSGLTALALAMLYTAKKSLKDMLNVLDLTLDLTAQIQKDYAASPKAFSPISAFQGVLHSLVHPTIETIIENQLGFFGWPVAIVYSKAFNIMDKRALKLLKKELSAETLSASDEEDVDLTPEQTAQAVQTVSQADTLLHKIRGHVVKLTERVMRLLTVPFYMLAFGSLMGYLAIVGISLWLTW